MEYFLMNTSSAIDVVLLIRQAKVITLEPSIKSYKAVAKQTQAKKPTNHEDEKNCSDTYQMEYVLMKK